MEIIGENLNNLVKEISETILLEDKKQKQMSSICVDGSVECNKNLSVTIHTKYLKWLFSLKLSIQKAQEQISSNKFIDQIADQTSNNDVLEHYVRHSEYMFFLGTFGLFEDFVSLILPAMISVEEYLSLKPDNFIPIMKKIEKLNLTNNQKDTIDFLSTFRNLNHNNLMYNKKNERPFPSFGKVFKPQNYFSFTGEEVLNWSKLLFEITDELAKRSISKNLIDKTV